ncbi:Sucraseferredoxin family protein [Actinokineospora spheciospongiae]|uniref:Sucraseferredoxin family protein n=1 Tax=Actinokineospora spheciospongiae TaxID=909613 RepID=W7IHE3_9PSEU|nr:sucrase ferredoxin [Actinokineospora spheciospongiae]EWC59728.1 Sucraseferredoxin family protein [Actinokineospora spheciospongiae]
MTAERCAAACVRRGDPMTATAPPVLRWLLVEQPKAWGPDPWRDCDLPAPVVAGLAERAASVGARVLLIRKPGRHTGTPLRWAYVDSVRELTWWSTFTDPHDLLTAPWPSGTPTAEPAYLVCAHGRHDTCCALRGRPVAAALAATRPEATWECSHVGGDRFAANLVALPHGFYFGQVGVDAVTGLADRFEAGRLTVPLLRGRSTVTAPVQAAQRIARERTGEDAVHAYAPVSVTPLGRDRWSVALDGLPEPIRLRATFTTSDSPLTCSATANSRMRSFIEDTEDTEG